MKTIHHYLKFATELDEDNSTAKILLSLPEEKQIQMLNLMLKDLLAPALQPAIDELNLGNSYATLKLAN